MNILFLQTASELDIVANLDTANLLGLFLAFIGIFIAVAVIFYLYLSFAFMSIAKKVGKPNPGLAWIPGIGPMIVANRISGMHWWPLLLFIGIFIPYLNFIAGPVFSVFSLIWMWKTFKVLGKPGWWTILLFIPLVNFIIIGIAAWSKSQQPVVNQVPAKPVANKVQAKPVVNQVPAKPVVNKVQAKPVVKSQQPTVNDVSTKPQK